MADNPLLARFYPESRFGGFSDVDGTIAFYSHVRAMLASESIVLDVGCGRGAGLREDPVAYRRNLRRLQGICRRVIGIDVDPEAASNPGIDEFHIIDRAGEGGWPVADASVDLIVSDFVLEHIEMPEAYFSEVTRVLKPGGVYCARTSNRLGYVGLAARLVHNRWHAWVLQRTQRNRLAVDVFPTRYRVNSVGALRRALRNAGLDGVVYGHESEPSYLGFAAWAYAFGKVLHVFTPSALRTCLFVFACKPTISED